MSTTPDTYTEIIASRSAADAAMHLADECRIKDATISALQRGLRILGMSSVTPVQAPMTFVSPPCASFSMDFLRKGDTTMIKPVILDQLFAIKKDLCTCGVVMPLPDSHKDTCAYREKGRAVLADAMTEDFHEE